MRCLDGSDGKSTDRSSKLIKTIEIILAAIVSIAGVWGITMVI